jgi:hypothetical protein
MFLIFHILLKNKALMMNRRKLMGLGGVIFCLAVLAESGAGAETAMSGEARIPAKHGVQVVVRADGSVVDRLAIPKSEVKPSGLPTSPEAWLARMMDPTRNGLAMKNPELFAEWLDAMTEPRFMTALASVAMTPGSYANTLGKAVDPAMVRNWLEFADPQIGMRWMAAGLDPHFYQAIFNRLTDSGKLRRWGFSPAASELTTQSPEWRQLPRETRANPWLPNSENYRY